MTEKEILLYNSLTGLHLLEKAPKAEVVRDLCGLQAQFSRNPQYSLWLRASDYTPETWDQGLVKIWSHRGTIHVVGEEEVGLYLSAADHGGEYSDGWWGLTAVQQRKWAPFIREQVRKGNDTREGLKRACTEAGMDDKMLSRVFYGWGGLIKEMCFRGQLACATGTQKRYLIPKEPKMMDRDRARAILILRYFDRFGPATVQDCRAFLGYKQKEMAPVLEEILPKLYCTVMEGQDYYHAKPLITQGKIPECVLIPGFDQLVMGYRDRTRFIRPDHARRLVNMAGIVFPGILLRGQIRARWKEEGGRVLVTPFEPLLKKDETAVRRTVKKMLGIREVVFRSA